MTGPSGTGPSGTGPFAVTWWGHATSTVEIAGHRVLLDPVLTDRLGHLRRHAPTPAPRAAEADLVLVSHLHLDHLHLPSLRRVSPEARIVVGRGGAGLVREFGDRVVEVAPGERFAHGDLAIEVLPAHHPGDRHGWSRHRAPALGFRVSGEGRSFWFPGDTGVFDGPAEVGTVDLALMPIGGWGPTLGPEHLDPDQAAAAVAAVGARWAVPVHVATFWPLGLRRLHPRSHRELFVEPIPRFVAALGGLEGAATPLPLPHGVRRGLDR